MSTDVTPQRCAHGTALIECSTCTNILDDERWLESERRQIEADQFSLDMRTREFERRTRSYLAKRRAYDRLRRRNANQAKEQP